ncbi:MAG TPA: hypothetical protein VLF88_02180 [Candidatus Babeliales bacterium]|nr:hypothetical protein [Candidatus Babeliales bacterium]
MTPIVDRPLRPNEMGGLARALLGIEGVKHTKVRLQDRNVFLRVNESIEGLYEEIRETANKFLGRLAAKVSRRGAKPGVVKRMPPKAVKRRRRRGAQAPVFGW